MAKFSEFIRRSKKFLSRRIVIGAFVILLVGTIIISYGFLKRGNANGDFITGTVARGTIEMSVVATGTVGAVTTVQVGSQVSGTIESLHGIDFNSIVQKGQVIAKLDQAIFLAQLKRAEADLQSSKAGVQTAEAAVNNQRANLASTRANLEAARVAKEDAERVLRRNKELFQSRVISDRDLEAAQAGSDGAVARHNEARARVNQAEAQLKSTEASLEQARAQVLQAQAAVDLARANLDHTVITSPIDGVVVSRNVDVGQTVAASLQAPTLFTIANDLTQMQVIAKVDEADIGKLAVGGPANFTVDAFPEDNFRGKITQIRLNAQMQQNVVIYDVVIEVSNPELKLRPGMTTNITMPVTRRENVLTIPNAALRFRPQMPESELAKIMEEMRAKWQVKKPEQANAEEAVAEAGGAAGQKREPQFATGEAGSERRSVGRGPVGGQGSAGRGQMGSASGGAEAGARWRGRRESGNRGPGEMALQPFTPGGRDDPNRASRGPRPGGADRNPPPRNASLSLQLATAQRTVRTRPQVVWVLGPSKKVEPQWVRVGITDGRASEIVDGELKEGDTIVLGQNIDASAAPQPQRVPFGGQQRGGGPGGLPRRF